MPLYPDLTHLLGQTQYSLKLKYVFLSAFLPSQAEKGGSCNFTFRSTPTMLTLAHADILPFLENMDEEAIRQKLFQGKSEDDRVFSRIGTFSHMFPLEEFEELAKIFTNFLVYYSVHLDLHKPAYHMV